MSKYIELIDKYRIEQSGEDTDYNPPNYIWADNTGEIVRCGQCKHWQNMMHSKYGTIETQYGDFAVLERRNDRPENDYHIQK